ncbi:geranylgeranyl reductase family protein [Rhabdothermincola salaria]|uniref:geranylgeranyl reductase family protein n=1 Tax=Rhabdothermincola salaria TaxID=2903142 RepID=UPI001E565173|nr:geranylgeranyl reductase family protein [Rhabdothermincola salaria]MCD9623549.1 geranylgeranyl reductase family protein [Rhabdothermincola salaria]
MPPEPPSGPHASHTPETDVDVLVVGAGPAGAATAICLAQAGRRVLVVDRARFPRDKICGDGLTTSALRELESLGLDPAAVASWTDVGSVAMRSPRGHHVTFPLPRGSGRYGAVARRRDLDAALVDLARASGATVAEGHPLRGARLDDATGDLVADVDGIGAVRARHGVGADGMWSPLRKALGVNPPAYRGEWHALRQYLTGVSDEAASTLTVWFEPDLLPGYAWSFPLGEGRANVGFGIQRGGSYDVGDMGALWRELLARPHIRSFLGPAAEPEGAHRAWPIPARVQHMTLAHGPVLFVGDAAAATDPMTGEGIGQALLTGRWAAEAILSVPASPATEGRRQAGESYRRRVHHELAVDHRLADRLIAVLRHRSGVRATLRAAGSTSWTRRNFARWLYEDYPRALLLTPSRWHRGMFTGPGAYRSGSVDGTA